MAPDPDTQEATAPGDAQRAVRRRAQREISAGLKRPAFSARTRAFLDSMIFDGLTWKEAAREAGIKIRTARHMLSHPRVLQEMQRRAQMVRTAEGARNPVLAAAIRDRGFSDEATAAQQKVSLEAARYLDGAHVGATTNNFNGPTVIAGYVIDLSGASEGPRQITRPAPPTINHNDE